MDDTLYDNVPIILRAEESLLSFINDEVMDKPLTAQQWSLHKQTFSKQNPHLSHDVSALRQAFLVDFIAKQLPKSEPELAAKAYQLFFEQRNNFSVADAQVDLLLSLKKRYLLVALTNGNASPDMIGLGGIFDLQVRPNAALKMKPDGSIFKHTEHLLEVASADILHIGDSPLTDVSGAIINQWQAAWYNPNNSALNGAPLPHFEYSQSDDLRALLC
nr:HAD family hydrolase [Gayadomonas joobiniege]